jgi:hypothetical protein
MMFGFGDDQNPYTESVDLLEDLVIEYITEMVGPLTEFNQNCLASLAIINFHLRIIMLNVYFYESICKLFIKLWQWTKSLIRIQEFG